MVQVLRKKQSDLFVELRTAQGQERLDREATASRRSELRRQVGGALCGRRTVTW